MFLFLLIGIVFGLEKISWFTSSTSGDCEKTKSTFEKIYIPNQSLLHLSVWIYLENLDGSLPEYPTAKPIAYGRLDGVPNEKHHDYFVNLKQKSGFLINENFPPVAEMLIVRIDGGLLDELHFFNAYSVHGWHYSIHVKAAYCPSQQFTSLPWEYDTETLYCDIPVKHDISKATGLVGSLIYVPSDTAVLKIESSASYSISFNNFASKLQSNSNQILFPKQGLWYILANLTEDSQLSIDLEQCFINKSVSCLNESVVYLSHVETHEEIPDKASEVIQSNTESLHLSVPIVEEDLKYRYGVIIKGARETIKSISYSFRGLKNEFSLCTDTKNFCEKNKNKITAEIEYPILGQMYVNIYTNSSSAIQAGFFRTRVGDHMCHGQPYINFNDTVYYCTCFQNKAGFYCQKNAISDSLYMMSIMFLTLSNLTMCLALIYGFKIGAYVEITAFGANMIASYFYHWCDESYFCFGFPYYSLMVTDFILSFFSICVSIVYIAKIVNIKLKFSVLLAILVGLMYLGMGTGFNMFETSILPLFVVGMIPIVRYGVFVYKESKKQYGKWVRGAVCTFLRKSGNFRWKWMGMAVLSLVAALISRGFQLNYNYYITHSLWHVFVMLSAFCVLRSVYYEKEGFSFKKDEMGEMELPFNGLDAESPAINKE